MGPLTQSKQICMIIKLEQGKFLQIDNAPGLAKKIVKRMLTRDLFAVVNLSVITLPIL